MAKQHIYDNKWVYRFIYGIMIVSFIILFIATFYFVCQFKDYSLSDYPENWGQFGDYFGGVFNPLLTIINIGVFALLTLTIQKINDQGTEQALHTQRKIALMSLKQEEAKIFIREMDTLLKEYQFTSDGGWMDIIDHPPKNRTVSLV